MSTNEVIPYGMQQDRRRTQCSLWSNSKAKRSKVNSIWKNRVWAHTLWKLRGWVWVCTIFYYRQKSRHMMERMGYDLTKGSGLHFDKGKRVLFRSFVPKGKDPITIIRPEEGSVTYLRWSHQIPSLKKRSIMTAHQQHRHGTQMSASAISSKVSQWIWYQPAI